MEFEGFPDIFQEQSQEWPYPDAQPNQDDDSEFVVYDDNLDDDFMPLPEQEVVVPVPRPVRRQLPPPPAPRRSKTNSSTSSSPGIRGSASKFPSSLSR